MQQSAPRCQSAWRRRSLGHAAVIAVAMAGTLSQAMAAVPLPRPRPDGARPAAAMPLPPRAPAAGSAARQVQFNPVPLAQVPLAQVAPVPSTPVPPARVPLPTAAPASPTPVTQPATPPPLPQLSPAATTGTSPNDLKLTRQAIDLAQAGKGAEATRAAGSISDPLARKLVEWVILRDDDNIDFRRFAAFIAANPDWPSLSYLRRRAEAVLWQDRVDGDTVRRFFARTPPSTAKGRFALANALLAAGDQAGAKRLVALAWRENDFSDDVEERALRMFGSLITAAEDKQRMDARLYDNDNSAALRAAKRLGGHAPAIAKARIAVSQNSKHAKRLLAAVPAAARHDPGYLYSHIQWLRRHDQNVAAAKLLHEVPRDPARLYDLDDWWIERRLIARQLLDEHKPGLAYQVAREAVTPARENYKAEHEFIAGWIALRFLHNPKAAAPHFARIAAVSSHPITRARSAYWQGRAAEAAGQKELARRHYGEAAQHQHTYYGQLARAKLGLGTIKVSAPPPLTAARRSAIERLEVVRAVSVLYAIEERDLVVPAVYDLAHRIDDVGVLTVLAEIAARNHDARATLLIGKVAIGRHMPFGVYAFPTFGMPQFKPIGPSCELSVIYSIARQESTFNPRVVSSAKAMGLMQVTPAAGRYIARKFNVSYDGRRLLSDPVYNVQMGSAELCDLIHDYNGSYILSFVGYNAGRGRVQQWLKRFGDPRDPKVDTVDWVERIPFSETRNYVERVLENVQVYRALFSGKGKLMIEADLQRGAAR